jgi:hypothetical protein
MVKSLKSYFLKPNFKYKSSLRSAVCTQYVFTFELLVQRSIHSPNSSCKWVEV